MLRSSVQSVVVFAVGCVVGGMVGCVIVVVGMLLESHRDEYNVCVPCLCTFSFIYG